MRTRAGRDPASPGGSARAAADSRDGVAAGRTRARSSGEIRRGTRGAVAAGGDARDRAPRDDSGRAAPSVSFISKASERRGARSARRGGDDDVPSRSTRRDPDPYPSLASFEGRSTFAAPPGARGCASAARRPSPPGEEKDFVHRGERDQRAKNILCVWMTSLHVFHKSKSPVGRTRRRVPRTRSLVFFVVGCCSPRLRHRQ